MFGCKFLVIHPILDWTVGEIQVLMNYLCKRNEILVYNYVLSTSFFPLYTMFF